jgi:IS30 family transposase
MEQTTQYRQRQPEDRMTMASMKQQGLSAPAMARALSLRPSSITRELGRNKLDWKRSPQQSAATLERVFTDEPERPQRIQPGRARWHRRLLEVFAQTLANSHRPSSEVH